MKYRVESGFLHTDGKSYDPGSIVEIEDVATAKHYLGYGRISELSPDDLKEAPKPKEARKS